LLQIPLMVSRIFYFLFVVLLLSSCKEDKEIVWSLEQLEIFKAEREGHEVVPGNLNYKETKLYDEFGKQVQQWYFNKEGQRTTIEKFEFEKNSKLAQSSKFYNIKDSLLSYYKFEYNANGMKNKTLSYDASNDELLRIERFIYDEKGNRIKREICTALEEVIRTYEFKFDQDGNEKSFRVFNQNGDVLGYESYTITKKNEKNKWTEMWGFKDDEPITVHRREFRFFKITNKDNIDIQ